MWLVDTQTKASHSTWTDDQTTPTSRGENRMRYLRWTHPLAVNQRNYSAISSTQHNRDAEALPRGLVNPGTPTGMKPVNLHSLEMQTIDMHWQQIKDEFCSHLIKVLEVSSLSDRMVLLDEDVTLSLDNGIMFYKWNFNGYSSDVLVPPKSMWMAVL